MSFIKWYREYRKSFDDSLIEYAKDYKLKINNGICTIPIGLENETLQLYNAYKHQKATNKLVIVTWVLAISTIVLSGVTIYFQNFK